MLRSMFSGVSGLRNHQVKMDVLANNIANVNTYGYKASRTSFQEMFNQTLSSAASPSASNMVGGTNPKQIGLGVSTVAIDVLHSVGATQSTDRTLDVMIEGEGFLTVKRAVYDYAEDDYIEKPFYTRAGNMYLDSFGFLVTAEGLYVEGAMILTDDTSTGDIPNGFDINSDLREELMEAEAYQKIQDNLDDDLIKAPITLEDIYVLELPFYAANDESNSGLTNRNETFGRIVIPSYFKQIAIDTDGVISGLNENNIPIKIAILTITTFVNPGGLRREGSNLYTMSNNSGGPAVGLSGIENAGIVKSGALEMSNVDLSKEFTDMIITQRGFQANSRVITVSDTLLEELINLKR